MPHNDPNPNFDAALDRVLRRRGQAPEPAGLEQRLAAALWNASELDHPTARSREPRMSTLVAPLPGPSFRTADALRAPRGRASIWSAVGLHAVAVALIGIAVLAQTRDVIQPLHPEVAVSLTLPPPPPLAPPRVTPTGGGGGHHDLAPPTVGHLPKVSPVQIVPPSAAPVIEPKLAVAPSINVDRDLKMADNAMPNLGVPNSTLKGFSLGSGSGGGLGSGSGNGLGPGSVAGSGGGVFRVGGSVLKPILILKVEPEFSEEARKAKFSGNVTVYIQINEQGIPEHVRVARGIGMGLDEKAVEAVRQYRFKPATKDGRPVKVEMYVDVDFTIL